MTIERFPLELKLASGGEDATFTGLASTFGGIDRHGDTIAPGAYARTLAEHKAAGTMPALLWSHDPSEPIGVIDALEESPAGLTIKGRLADTVRGRDARTLAKMGAIGGLSIGFRTRKASTGPNATCVLEDIELIEISMVASPADPRARLASVKAADAAERSVDMTTQTTGAAPDLAAIETRLAALASEVKAATDRADALETAMARPAIITGKADGQTPEAKAFGRFIRKGEAGMSADEVKTLRVSNDAAGGYLAPEQFGAELIKLTREFSPIRQYARVVTIGAESIKYPRRTGSTAATWTGEIADRTESEPSFGQLTLTPHELSTFTEVSNTLLEDAAYPLEAELAADLAESFAESEGVAFAVGDGVAKPRGILSATGIAEMVSGSATGFGGGPADVLIRMFHGIKGVHAQNGAWAMNRTTLGTIRQFKDAQGRYIVLDGLTPGAPVTLLGRPVVEMVDLPNVAAGAFPIIFGDWQGYRIVDRVQMALLRDPYTRATNGITRFVARKRVGADVTHADRFIKLKIAAS
jgi:HK97 family phage major capsid protein